MGWEQKKSSPKSDELLNMLCKLFRSNDLTYLSRHFSQDGIGTFFPLVREEVVKAS